MSRHVITLRVLLSVTGLISRRESLPTFDYSINDILLKYKFYEYKDKVAHHVSLAIIFSIFVSTLDASNDAWVNQFDAEIDFTAVSNTGWSYSVSLFHDIGNYFNMCDVVVYSFTNLSFSFLFKLFRKHLPFVSINRKPCSSISNCKLRKNVATRVFHFLRCGTGAGIYREFYKRRKSGK